MQYPIINQSNQYNKNILAKFPLSADSLAIASLSQQHQQPLLVICNDMTTLNRMYNELQFFSSNRKIDIFPDYELLPYEKFSPYNEVIANRIKTLWKIHNNQTDIVLVAANSLQNRLAPLEYIYQSVLILEVGQSLNVSGFRSKLSDAGYACVSHVGMQGEFAVRGGIIDIMPMGSKKAVRIELFDDEIESVNYLDVATNKLLNALDKLEIIPAREYPQDKQQVQQMAMRFIDKFPKNLDSDTIKDLSNHIVPAGSEFLLPLFFEHTASIFDYLSDTWQIVYSDELHSNLNLHNQEITRRYDLCYLQYPCLRPSELYFSIDYTFSCLKKHITWCISSQGELYKGFNQLAKWSNLANDFKQLQLLAKSNQLVIVLSTLGKLEIFKSHLQSNNVSYAIINSLTDALSDRVNLLLAPIYYGFSYSNTIIISETELYSQVPNYRYMQTKQVESKPIDNDMIVRDLAEIVTGDLVVHVNYGIGRYNGIVCETFDDTEYEFLEIEYQDGATLMVPVYNLHLISRYSRLDVDGVALAKLGSNKWSNLKNKTTQKIYDIAADLLELYAKRELERGLQMDLPDSYQQFCDGFSYTPTVDQQTSINDIITDLTSHKPMDRLVCGDVGFGKTEVAMRAAFICAMNGYQVAILAPTTLLAEQHYQNLVNRFAGFNLKIAEVSRFKTKKENSETLSLAKHNKIDILVGTHRIIQNDVEFASLGLLIIDEEHRFGVKQKERLKQLRKDIHVLTMTATPIPRTLSMALDGIRDFSIIATPPSRRLSVNTEHVPDNDTLIAEAILREIRRGGQVFFLYNDVASINQMYDRLIKLVPQLRIAIAHGQMNEHDLEFTIKNFIRQQYNLLLCSTIIETGIDIPNANTIIIYRADKLGLAQIHQLRGRVGRSYHQAYCYLITPEKITKDAQLRIDAILSTKELGSGFNLAMHDMEIRGAGEILGSTQAGNIKEVGLSLYTDMLASAVKSLRNNQRVEVVSEVFYCEVSINATALIPHKYCPNVQERLITYKRLARANEFIEIDEIYRGLIDNYGLPPQEIKNLIKQHEVRLQATKLGINKVDITNNSISLGFIDKPNIEPMSVIKAMQELKTCKYDGKNRLVWSVVSGDVEIKFKNTLRLLDLLS